MSEECIDVSLCGDDLRNVERKLVAKWSIPVTPPWLVHGEMWQADEGLGHKEGLATSVFRLWGSDGLRLVGFELARWLLHAVGVEIDDVFLEGFCDGWMFPELTLM